MPEPPERTDGEAAMQQPEAGEGPAPAPPARASDPGQRREARPWARQGGRRGAAHVELEALREKLREAEETLSAIRAGEVDAILVSGPGGDKVYTLTGADEPYRRLVEDMNEGAGSLDEDGTVLYANAGLAAMLCAPLHEVIGWPLGSWIAPDRRGAFARLLEAGEGAAELAFAARGGGVVPVLLSLSPFRSPGGPRRCFIATDLTHQKATEGALRAAARRLAEAQAAGHVGSWELDPDTGDVAASDELGRIYGAEPSRLADRAALMAPLHPQDRDALEMLLDQTLAEGGDFEVEVRLVQPAGHLRWVLVRGQRVVGPGPGERRLVVMVQDITDRKAAEEEQARSGARAAAIERLEAASAMRQQMLFVLAHELNTPLTPILMQLQLLADRGEPLTERQARALEVIRRSFDRLSRLVQDLLDMSRIEAGRLSMERAEVDLAAMLQHAVASMAPTADEAGVALELACPGPLAVHGDAERLEQVVVNLLTNALRYTPRGGQVRVGAEASDGEVVVRVRDTGPGIAPAKLPLLFTPFRQLDPPLRGAGGNGLGLFISKGIVEQHGGRIWCESEGQGRGATFAFAIPRRAGAGRGGSDPAQPRPRAEPATAPPQPG